MKLRATLARHRDSWLTRLLNAVDKLGDQCGLSFTNDTLHVTPMNNGLPDLSGFGVLKNAIVFEQLTLSSKFENNEIRLVVNTGNLLRALTTGASYEQVQMRLVRQNKMPVLRFTCTAQTMKVVQNVPVGLRAAGGDEEWPVEPSLDEPKVGLVMPDVARIFKVVDSFKSFSKRVTWGMEAENGGGQLIVGVVDEDVSIKTTFPNLAEIKTDEGADEEEGEANDDSDEEMDDAQAQAHGGRRRKRNGGASAGASKRRKNNLLPSPPSSPSSPSAGRARSRVTQCEVVVNASNLKRALHCKALFGARKVVGMGAAIGHAVELDASKKVELHAYAVEDQAIVLLLRFGAGHQGMMVYYLSAIVDE